MTQSIIGCGTNSGIAVTIAAPIQNVIIGSGAAPNAADATEANVQTTWRQAGVFSGLTAKVTAASDADSTFAYRKSAANGNQVVTLTAATTGTFTDSTHTDTAAAGDIINGQFVNAGSTTSMTIRGLIYVLFAPTTSSNTVNKLSAATAISDSSVSASFYQAVGGRPSSVASASTEANAQFKNKATATLQNLYVNSSANTRVTDSTVRSRKNTANGNLIATVTALTSGAFEDTSNSDSLTSGDLINTSLNTSTGAGTLTINIIAVDYVTTAAAIHYVTGGDYPSVGTAKRYAPLAGGSALASGASSSSLVSVKAGIAITISNLESFVVTNTATNNSTITVFKNDVAGNEVLTYATTVTGYLEDATHADVFTATDKISYEFVTTTSGNIVVGSYGVLGTYPTPEVITLDKWLPNFHDRVIRRRAHPAAAVQQGPVSTAFVEATQLDKWLPLYPDRSRALVAHRSPTVLQGPVSTIFVETAQPDKWLPIFPDRARVRTAHRQTGHERVGPISNVFAETSTLDKWNPSFPDRAWRKRQHAQAGHERAGPLNAIFTEGTFPDKWMPEFPALARRKRQHPQAGHERVGPLSTIFGEDIFPDKWLPVFADRAQQPKQRVLMEDFVYGVSSAPAEVITLDKWISESTHFIAQASQFAAQSSTQQYFSLLISTSLVRVEWIIRARHRGNR